MNESTQPTVVPPCDCHTKFPTWPTCREVYHVPGCRFHGLTETPNTRDELMETIQSYLEHGGLFNPEMMEHQKVRDLILACRDRLALLEKEISKVKEDRDYMEDLLGTASSQRDALVEKESALHQDSTEHCPFCKSPRTWWKI